MTDKPVDEYPLSVIGTIRNGRTYYYIQNMVTGERDCILYDDSAMAHDVAQLLHEGTTSMLDVNEHGEYYSATNIGGTTK